MKKRTKTLLTCLAVPLGVGAASACSAGMGISGSVDRTVCNDGNSILSDRASAGIGREEKSIGAVWNTACSELSVAGIFL